MKQSCVPLVLRCVLWYVLWCVCRRYLAGVLDFTGELNRYAVARATARDVGAVLRARDVVDALQGQFLQMDLRNGALR